MFGCLLNLVSRKKSVIDKYDIIIAAHSSEDRVFVKIRSAAEVITARDARIFAEQLLKAVEQIENRAVSHDH